MSMATAMAVASCYGLGTPVREPAYADRGELGLIWRLETDRGSWAVKELLAPPQEADAARDVAFQLAAEAEGVPLPRPRRTLDGRVLLPGEEAACPRCLRVYAWAALADGQVVTGAEIGEVTARLHEVRHAGAGPMEAWFSAPVGEAAWPALLAQARSADAPWAVPLERQLADLAALDAAIAPPDPARLRTCHRDLGTENVRRTSDGGVIVLDWDNAGPAPPERELAAIVSDLAADLSPEAAVEAYAAYLAAAGPARLTGSADFSMAAAAQGHLLQFCGRRALNPAESPQNRERAQRRLDQMLRRPLTIAWIGTLLELLTR
jgi:Ser/Thr protein kinase RdoA (MazF antagonist)